MEENKIVEYKEYALERLTYGLNYHLKNIPENQKTAKVYIDDIAEGLILSLKARIYGTKRQIDYISYPANWKEAIKERFLPKWVKKIFPVKYKNIKIVSRITIPDITIPKIYNAHLVYDVSEGISERKMENER